MDIDGLTYPSMGLGWVKHKQLGPILQAITKKKLNEENYLFLAAMIKKAKYNTVYHGFISAKAKHMINISSKVRDPMVQAAELGNFYDKKLWKDGLDAAQAEIVRVLQGNISEKDLKDVKAFRVYHHGKQWQNRLSLYRKWKTSKEVKKVQKFLQDTDGKMLNDVLEAYAAIKYNPKQAKKSIDRVAQASGKKSKDVKSFFSRVFK